MSDPVSKTREMLKLGINIQATGDATDRLVTVLLQGLLARIDELEEQLDVARFDLAVQHGRARLAQGRAS